MPTIIYLHGRINFENFNQACKQHHLNAEQTVFIFPGNPSHHSAQQTLFSRKSGGGLASVAYDLAEYGVPTLSLPTTGMGDLHDDKTKALAERAIADLWRAVGFGFNLALPVRAHTNTTYFDGILDHVATDKLEPSFWGGIEKAANKSLGNYYLSQLNSLYDFLEQGNKKIQHPAYHEGDLARSSLHAGNEISPWFVSILN